MDTKLKGKKIKALIYRMIAAGAFCTLLFTGIMGREAFENLERMEEKAFSGDLFYLTEFREYVAGLYQDAMNGYAGLGDDFGFPLTGKDAVTISKQGMEQFKEEMDQAGGDILYYVDITGNTSKIKTKGSNIKYPLFSEYDGHLLLPDTMKCLLYWDGPGNTMIFFDEVNDAVLPNTTIGSYLDGQYCPNVEQASKMRFLLALDTSEHLTSDKLLYYRDIAEKYQFVLFVFFGSAILFVLAGVFCLISCKKAHLMWQDFAQFSLKIWMEWKILILGLFVSFCYYQGLFFGWFSNSFRRNTIQYMWMYWLLGMVFYLLYKDLQLNKFEIVRHSLLGSVIRFLRDYYKGVKWYKKALTISALILLGAFVMIVLAAVLYYYRMPDSVIVICVVMGILSLFAFYRISTLLMDVNRISQRLHMLSEGNLCDACGLSPRSLLKQTAQDLDTVEDGISAAVEQQNRANKMRVELITNVSHDLKTPLTAIINYADLLCGEHLPAPAGEYAEALQAKAYRLKNMVQDVFTLSKATSGNLPVEKTILDLAKLLKQTLADMDERIQESSLTVRLSIATEPVLIEADGEKLYRVFQNLILNALQYSLDHSRIHVQLTVEDTQAIAKIKNTSRQELDFDTVKLMERFVRADSSRSTEGSGLGLSIAQSFTEACGGSFHIETDADMFIACVCFPLKMESTLQNDSPDAFRKRESLEVLQGDITTDVR